MPVQVIHFIDLFGLCNFLRSNTSPILPLSLTTCCPQFDKFKRMGLNKHEIVILMAAGHTIAGGIEGAWFDNTPTKFDADWFGVSVCCMCVV